MKKRERPTGKVQGNANSCNGMLDRLKAQFRTLAKNVLADDELGEAQILSLFNELRRDCLESRLCDAAALETDLITVGWTLHKRIKEHEVVYHSICGPSRVLRGGYRERGKRNPSVLIALVKKFGLIDRMTPDLASCIVHGRADL